MVGVEDGADSLRDNDRGGFRVLTSQSPAQQGIRLIIQRAGGIIQNQNFRVAASARAINRRCF